MSDNLYMTVCSKTILFHKKKQKQNKTPGQMNNFNHVRGIEAFSCTEPPSGGSHRVGGKNRGPEDNIWFERWLAG